MKIEIYQDIHLDQLKNSTEYFRQHLNSCHKDEVYPKVSISELLEGRDLPPNGILENQRVLLFLDETHRVAGHCVIYLGYPNTEICYIGKFSIDKPYKGQGLGKKALKLLFDYVSNLGDYGFRLGVDHCNIEALGFWFSQGFTKITKVSSTKSPPVIELEFVNR